MEPVLAPVATPLPPAPPLSILTKTQWAVLYALLDGAVPSVAAKSAIKDPHTQVAVPDDEFQRILENASGTMIKQPSPEALAAFLAFRPVDDAKFQDDVLRTVGVTPALPQLIGLLDFLNTRLGSLVLTGRWTPIHHQPTRVRESILKGWTTSRITFFKSLAKNFYTIAQKAHSMTGPVFRELAGYVDVPDKWEAREGFDFNFLQPGPGDETHVINTDVVIVGSGPGGGVSAKNLAEAGHDVLVLDKGYYFPPSHLPMTQDAATSHLFDGGNIFITESGGMGILSGGAWGGGGTVNWSVCLRLQDFVRREWSAGGLPLFESPEFDECMDRVWEFAGAGTDGLRHNQRNRVLLDGAKKLGWVARLAAQNTAGKEHYCGHCHMGCGLGEKRGPAVSWLPAASKAGAKFMEGFRAEKVVFAEDGVTATGVEGLWTSRGPNGEMHTAETDRTQRRVLVKAKKVIVSGGTLQSPLLLKRSGITNRHVGENLHLHPVNFVSAVYDEETKPWEGGIITSYCSEFENLDGTGHGVKLEPTSMIPYTVIAMSPWSGGVNSKLVILKYPHQATFISLTRDRDVGRVFEDPKTGKPRIAYDTSDYDRGHTTEGVIALAKLCYVTGAKEIRPHVAGLPMFVPDHAARNCTDGKDPEFTDAAFAAWLNKVRQVCGSLPVALGTWSSAHQMGTCRMGKSAKEGVVDGMGKVYGREGLYVADASVFPSASGVNPMVTLMAVSDWISRGLDKELRKG